MRGPQKTLELPQIPEFMKPHETENQEFKVRYVIPKRNISLKPLDIGDESEGAEKKKSS